MTHLPRYLLTLFASLHAGDDLILNKGLGEENWKVELIQRIVPKGDSCPLPMELWGNILGELPWDWQGKIRFYSEPQQRGTWCVSVSTHLPIAEMKISGMAVLSAVMKTEENQVAHISRLTK